MKEKNTKVIAIGEAAIDYLADIKKGLEENANFENIKVTKDVDKEFVRCLLDGIEILYIIYDSSDKDACNITKAVSFMANERKVLCIGFDICLKENKDDLGVDKEFKLNKYNQRTTIEMINLISEAIDEETLMYIDISDLKELFQGDGAVSYAVEEFELGQEPMDVAKALEEDFYKSEGDLTLKKGLLLAETSQMAGDNTLMYLNEIRTAILDILAPEIEFSMDIIFSYNEKEKSNDNMKIAYLKN